MSGFRSKTFTTHWCGCSQGFNGKGTKLCARHMQTCCSSMWGMLGKCGGWSSVFLLVWGFLGLGFLNEIVFEKVIKYYLSRKVVPESVPAVKLLIHALWYVRGFW